MSMEAWEAWKSFFDIGAIVLLFLTFLFGIGILVTGNIINGRQEKEIKQFGIDLKDKDVKISEANDKAGAAIERASNADERASKNEKEAARLNKLSEDEKAARVAIQTQLAWREPTDEQLNRVRDSLLLFRGQQFDVVTYATEPECLNLTNRIYSVAIAAQWVLDPKRKFSLLGSILSGVELSVSEESAHDTKNAARAFAESLSKEKVSAIAKIVPLSENPPRPGLIVIYIGKNPASMTPVSIPQ